MGIFRDMAGIAAGAAGISARKAKAKKVLDEHRQRAQEELSNHEAEFKEYLASERTRYLSRKEHYIVTYMFTQMMLGSTMGQRDFSFLDQMTQEYRSGNVFHDNLKKVETEYYSFLAQAFKDGEITASSMILALKDLLYFKEIRDEVQLIIASESVLQDEMTASSSIFTDCEDVESLIKAIRDFNIIDCNPTIGAFSDGVEALDNGDYKSAVKHWLYGSYSKEDFVKIKLALLHFAQDENQDIGAVELYGVYTKLCRRLFGISKVKVVDGEEKVILYPSVDMVIAEELRHIHSGSADQYDETLQDWLSNCGTRVDRNQLDVLQNVFFHFGAFGQEQIVLEYMVKNNMPRTPDQEQRLRLLKGNGVIGAGSSSVAFDTLDVQKFPMVIDEWQKDVSLQGIRWNDEHISQLIRDGLIRNFGDMYRVSIVQAGAAIEGWVDTLPTIHVQTKDSFVRNSELSFLISGEQITNSSIHLIIMVLLSPADANGQLLESDSLYKKVVAIKENHNPRIDTFISTMKNILITELENWINQFNNDQDIY